MSYTSPMRRPDTRSPEIMSRRAWWLVGLNILIPGSAQLLAGSRRLGRFGVSATFLLWALVVAVVVVAFVDRSVLVPLVANSWVIAGVAVVAAFYGVLWIVLTLDTLRLVRFVNLRPALRGAVAGLAVIGLAAAVVPAGYAVSTGVSAIQLLDSVFAESADIADPVDGRYNILLLGGDAGKDRVGLRPDSISVVSIDAETGRTAIIGVPRNLTNVPFSEDSPMWSLYPDGYSCDDCLISYLYTIGMENKSLYPGVRKRGSTAGVEATRDAVEGVTGLEIPYYVLVDMRAFEDLIDALGGIEITVDERLPIGGGLDEYGNLTGVNAWVEEGTQVMDGRTALWYARSRHSTDDYDRMERQREVQEAILKQFEPANVLLRFQQVARAGEKFLDTDIPQEMLSHFVSLAELARAQKVDTLELVPPRIETWNPDYAKIQRLVARVTAPKTASPTPAAED